MKKYLIWASVLLLAVGCSSFQTATYEEEMAMPLKENGVDTLFYSISLEYVTGGLPKEACKQINDMLLTTAFGLEEAPGTVEESAIRYRENLIDEYLNENAVLENGVRTWEDRLGGAFQKKYKNYLNYLVSYYSFRGGAHGIQTLSNIVFDAKTGVQVHEADLFTPGYEAPVTQLLRLAVKSSMEEEDPEFMQLVNLEQVVPNGNFSVHEDGVEWLFQPYEVGPYALGIVSATLSWDELKPFMKQ